MMQVVPNSGEQTMQAKVYLKWSGAVRSSFALKQVADQQLDMLLVFSGFIQ